MRVAAVPATKTEDGGGENSPFATALVKHLSVPGLDIRLAFGRVRDEVLKRSRTRQEPFIYGSLGGESISLVPAASQEREAAQRRDEEANRLKAEEAARKLAEREAAKRREEEAKGLKVEEAARKLAEREAAQRREEQAKRLKAEEAVRAATEREAARKREEQHGWPN